MESYLGLRAIQLMFQSRPWPQCSEALCSKNHCKVTVRVPDTHRATATVIAVASASALALGFLRQASASITELIVQETLLHMGPLLYLMENGRDLDPTVSMERYGLYLLLQRHRMAQYFPEPSLGSWKGGLGGKDAGQTKIDKY